MSIKGKIVGSLLGLLGGPFGAVLGGVLGHLLDSAFEDAGPERSTTSEPRVASEPSCSYLVGVVGLIVAVADAGEQIDAGRVGRIKSHLLDRVNLTAQEQLVVGRIIDEVYANRDDINVDYLCLAFEGRAQSGACALLVRLLFEVTRLDGLRITTKQEELIQRVSRKLGIDETLYRDIHSNFADPPTSAYQTLELDPACTVEEAKRAYRRLAARYHPDHVGSGGEARVREAEEKFKSLQSAYREIRDARGF